MSNTKSTHVLEIEDFKYITKVFTEWKNSLVSINSMKKQIDSVLNWLNKNRIISMWDSFSSIYEAIEKIPEWYGIVFKKNSSDERIFACSDSMDLKIHDTIDKLKACLIWRQHYYNESKSIIVTKELSWKQININFFIFSHFL